jgi:hypothetical protein
MAADPHFFHIFCTLWRAPPGASDAIRRQGTHITQHVVTAVQPR